MASQEVAELQHSQKFMEEVDSSEVRQTGVIKAILTFLGEYRIPGIPNR